MKLRVPVFGIAGPQDGAGPVRLDLRVLLRSGVPILEALDIVPRRWTTGSCRDAVEGRADSGREGESIAKPLAKHPVFPPMVVQMMAVGEETGQVDKMLEKIATSTTRRSRRRSTP